MHRGVFTPSNNNSNRNHLELAFTQNFKMEHRLKRQPYFYERDPQLPNQAYYEPPHKLDFMMLQPVCRAISFCANIALNLNSVIIFLTKMGKACNICQIVITVWDPVGKISLPSCLIICTIAPAGTPGSNFK